ncbi:AraC family transcriptional regulator [Mycolicibacterium wolinskyi]|uniref:AraC family transcriptional regulator n=1 Tax=Mycolicibacterium wolinskyi TaxID=59750 RepID=UPI003917B59F
MRYTRHTPAVALRDSVDHLWCIADGPRHSAERILPTGTTELVVNLGADTIAVTNNQGCQRFSGTVLAGPYTTPFDIDARMHTAMVGVHFKPGGARTVLGFSPPDLLDSHVDLHALWNGAADTIRAELCEAGSDAERFAILESALLALPANRTTLTPEVAFTVDALGYGTPHPPIAALAREVGFSHRRLVQLFTQQVGVPPKRFARVRRFRHAHHHVMSAQSLPHWPGFALAHGYADQSHMIREFRRFSGLTPVQHFRGRNLMSKDDHLALRQ